jgi:hypothetical protein
MGKSQARRRVRRNDFNFVSVEFKTTELPGLGNLAGALHGQGVVPQVKPRSQSSAPLATALK